MSLADDLGFGEQGPGGPGATGVLPLAPPTGWLIGALGLLVASSLLLFSGSFSDIWHVVGWLLASIGAISALARFTAVDLTRRQMPNYSPRPAAGHIRLVLALAAIALSAAHAWTLAWSLAAR